MYLLKGCTNRRAHIKLQHFLLICVLLACHFTCSTSTPLDRLDAYTQSAVVTQREGGGGSKELDNNVLPSTLSTQQLVSNNYDDDDERYSRQLYTMGAKSHARLRSSTIIVDGPAESGLVYEIVKNLALSGVHKIILVKSTVQADVAYHYSQLDDLGQAYMRGAKTELDASSSTTTTTTTTDLLAKYAKVLNPSVQTEYIDREDLQHDNDSNNSKANIGGDVVLVCVDRPYDTQVELNQWSRQHKVKFVAVETAGVYGRLFCDFGNEFVVEDADGESPPHVPLDKIVVQNDDDSVVLVTVGGDEKHDVSAGDTVQFFQRNGAEMDYTVKVVRVQTPQRFLARINTPDLQESFTLNTIIESINKSAGYFSRVKSPQTVTFKPLKEIMDDDAYDNIEGLVCPCDWQKLAEPYRRKSMIAAFAALAAYTRNHHHMPRIDNYYDFLKLIDKKNDNSFEFFDTVKKFYYTCAAKFTPLQAIFGAIAAQEALKAATGLYNPIQQFLFYDTDEVLPVMLHHERKMSKTSTGMTHIFGKNVVNKLENTKIFVVGAGAIGCEILKNLAAMVHESGPTGKIILTDMDVIEKSNLSRQLLFRDSDIGTFKSSAASHAVRRLNPGIKIEAHSSKVGEDEQSVFNNDFWTSNVDIVLSALDNVNARVFVDEQCVKNGKALVDSGTLGVKGNCQVVVPNLSESYSSSVDPPEPAIPVCTLKHFPYVISHTIQWARDAFEGYYSTRIEQLNDLIDNLGSKTAREVILDLMETKSGEQRDLFLAELAEDISLLSIRRDDKDAVKNHCLHWATETAAQLFYDAPNDILQEHPLDSLDDDDEPFWSGTRRPPRLLWFDKTDRSADQNTVNDNLISFVRNAARLRAEVLNVHDMNELLSPDEVISFLTDYDLNKNRKTDTEGARNKIIHQLDDLQDNLQKSIAIDFEKDDPQNGHVAFITAASNLRAISYEIPPATEAVTRQTAGQIIPAIITTTAFVSALSCIETLKLVQNKPLNKHRNAFINLGLPFFALTQPLPAEEYTGPGGQTFTLWDKIVVEESKSQMKRGGITISKFLEKIYQKAMLDSEKFSISSITFGPYMLYMNFMHSDDHEYLGRSLWEQLEQVMEESDDATIGQKSNVQNLEFSVTIEDTESGEESYLPSVRVLAFQQNKNHNKS